MAEGDSVHTGEDIIGVVGEHCPPAESGRAAHLHFAMYRTGSRWTRKNICRIIETEEKEACQPSAGTPPLCFPETGRRSLFFFGL